MRFVVQREHAATAAATSTATAAHAVASQHVLLAATLANSGSKVPHVCMSQLRDAALGSLLPVLTIL
jgi:hypothetical protein